MHVFINQTYSKWFYKRGKVKCDYFFTLSLMYLENEKLLKAFTKL